jgi:ribose-phosphate pyrophosphokinase
VTGPVVFATRAYATLAAELCRLGGYTAGDIERRFFPDGERYQRILTRCHGLDVVVVGGTISDSDTLELYDLASGLFHCGAARLTLVIPYFGYSTMERAVHRGESVMAKNRARILSSVPRAKLGNRVVLCDLHSEGIPHYFEGTIRPFHVYAKPIVEQLARELGGEQFVLGSTDAGRAKWVESLANDLHVPAAFVYKRRLGPDETRVMAVSTRFSGETVVIYDDMIRTGSSLMNAARAYRDAGAGRIVAIATHAIFPGDALDRILASGLFSHVAATDTHPNARRLAERGLIVRSVASLFVPFLRSST